MISTMFIVKETRVATYGREQSRPRAARQPRPRVSPFSVQVSCDRVPSPKHKYVRANFLGRFYESDGADVVGGRSAEHALCEKERWFHEHEPEPEPKPEHGRSIP